MKKFLFPRCFAIFIAITIISTPVFLSCNSSTKSSSEEIKGSKDTSGSWYSDGEWLNGLDITPNKSINQQEFSRQYHLKNTWWGEALDFLKIHDLKTLAPGKYNIDSGNVVATVWEGVPKIKDSVLWEAHRKFNDLQYIIRGKAKMGITQIDEPNAKITAPYSKEEDVEHFTVSSGDEYYAADSSTFFIFSPKEIHRPAIKVDGDNPIKKIVIKVRVPQ
jgi:YhcH/YjgK/YiaL family protein